MTNLDVDALARFLYARKLYIEITDQLLEQGPMKTIIVKDLDQEETLLGNMKNKSQMMTILSY